MTIRISISYIIMLLCFGSLQAQLHDNVWLFGFSSNPDNLEYGGGVINFNGDSLDIFYEYRDMNLDITNASISDTSGNLLFYTNGIYIANALHEPMENGEGLNPGEYADAAFWDGYRLIQGAIVIPKPDDPNLYYIFHSSLKYLYNTIGWHSSEFYFTLVDMSEENGMGAVIEKNQILIDQPMFCGGISATKHANGRDWWLLIKSYENDAFYKFLLTPEGLINFGIQTTNVMVPHGLGQATFSPDGDKYIIYSLEDINDGNYLSIYDFDRCTGELSNPIQDILIDTAGTGGVAVSPNSQYLYLSSYNYIYQYDLEADDVLATKDTVAIYDGYEVEVNAQNNVYLPTRFFLMQLGPDDKIYINCPGSPNILHVINQPDSAGLACEVLQHHIDLPTYNRSSLPNFPNYRLGALEGSGCDTITSVVFPLVKSNDLAVFPNPATDQINLVFEENLSKETLLKIYSSTGQLVLNQSLNKGEKEFSINLITMESGIYFYEIATKNKLVLHSGKFSVIKK